MNGISARPRLLGLLCGAGAVAIGIAYMSAAGAPSRYLLVNLAALVLGATAWLGLARSAESSFSSAGSAIVALAMPLLLTALFGVRIDGASRWVNVGPLSLQISLIVVPVMLVLYARQTDRIGTVGIVIAALALAAQPDRAMAGVLLAGLLAAHVAKPTRLSIVAAVVSGLAFGWALLAPDALPAVPYVDRILYTAFDLHPLTGTALALGTAALVLPAIAAAKDSSARPALLAFGACWLAVVAAALLGNYPTPLVGYGGSAVLGYLLSVALLPSGTAGRRAGRPADAQPVIDLGPEQPTSEQRASQST